MRQRTTNTQLKRAWKSRHLPVSCVINSQYICLRNYSWKKKTNPNRNVNRLQRVHQPQCVQHRHRFTLAIGHLQLCYYSNMSVLQGKKSTVRAMPEHALKFLFRFWPVWSSITFRELVKYGCLLRSSLRKKDAACIIPNVTCCAQTWHHMLVCCKLRQ